MLITIKQFCLKEGIQNGLWVGVEAWKIKEKIFFSYHWLKLVNIYLPLDASFYNVT